MRRLCWDRSPTGWSTSRQDARRVARYSAGILLPYHLGRMTTYAALGAVVGAGGAALARVRCHRC
jgi:sulfite exporter TauE/SafE